MDQKLKSLLDTSGVQYQLIPHAATYTAMETAQAIHVKGHEMAKSVMLMMDGVLSMAVVPSTQRVSLQRLQLITGAENIAMADEQQFKEAFPDCEPGAMPPFGQLYGLPMYCAIALTKDSEIVFNAGTHQEAVKMAYRDFERLAHPVVAELSSPPGKWHA